MIKYQGISTLEVLIEAKNYKKWIADTILKYISTPDIEIGAVTGNPSIYFLENRPLYITDNDEGLVTGLENNFKDQKDIYIERLDITKEPSNKYRTFFSTVFSINMLEHIRDDEGALKNIYKLLKPKGKLLLIVPSKKWAFTKLDEDLGHFRRYEKKELFEKLTRNGYQVDKIFNLNIVGLLSWFVRDKVKRSKVQLKPYHIKVFDSIVPGLR